MAEGERRFNRRNFFRESMRELLKPIERSMEPLQEAVRQFDKLEKSISPQARRAGPGVWLRPPGALEEKDFLDKCSRCGKCVEVCPAQCIKLESVDGGRGSGAPFVVANEMPCMVCEGLKCMNHCPTGALTVVPLASIDMGTARWNAPTCVRKDGQDCTICIDRCPIGEVAIRLNGDRVQVLEDGCIGCGMCQYYCPTDPKSILVIPKSARS